jgi:phage protein D
MAGLQASKPPAAYVSVKEGKFLDNDLSALVISVSVEDNDRLVDEARVVFKDPDNKGSGLIEKQHHIEIELGWTNEHAVIFDGIVVDSVVGALADGTRTVEVVARDWSHPMSLEPVSEQHKPSKLIDLVTKIAHRQIWRGDRAVIDCDPKIELTERGDLYQHNVTDYKYLQDLAERWGARAFVEYNKGASRFYWVPTKKLLDDKPLGQLKYCRGTEKLIEFKYQSVAARSARQISATAVDPMSGAVKTTVTPPPAAPASSDGAAAAPPPPAVAVGLPSDPQRAARATILDPTRALGLTGTGRAVGTVMLRAKGKVDIVGIAPWAEGAWYIAKATHVWTDGGTAEVRRASYETSFTATR